MIEYEYYDLVIASLRQQLNDAREQITKLQAFKDWVHKRLDEVGVPHDPNPAKTAETGCRIGNRFNWLFDRPNV